MSRGPGHVERSVRRLFDEHPDEAFSLKDVVEFCYPGVIIPGDKHRVAVARAARAVLARDVDWVSEAIPGGTTWFYNMASPMSVAMWHMIGAPPKPQRIMARRRGLIPRRGSNSGRMTSQEALERLRPGGSDHRLVQRLEAVCELHRGRRKRLAGLNAEQRQELVEQEEREANAAAAERRFREYLGPVGSALFYDDGWTHEDIDILYTEAEKAGRIAARKVVLKFVADFVIKAAKRLERRRQRNSVGTG